MQIEDKILFNEIKNRDLKVCEASFYDYYPQLVRFAEGFIFDRQECEEIVMNPFIDFKEKAKKINLELSLKTYFFQSVKNRCLNHLRILQIHDLHNLLHIESLLNQENYEDDD